MDKNILWESQNLFTKQILQKVSIKESKIERKISESEASEMLGLLNKTASYIIEKSKETTGVYENIKIKAKPRVKIGRCFQASGEVKLKVTFADTARVTDVEVVTSSGCLAFDQNAILAAKGIRFEPAKSGDESISVNKTIIYTFRIL